MSSTNSQNLQNRYVNSEEYKEKEKYSKMSAADLATEKSRLETKLSSPNATLAHKIDWNISLAAVNKAIEEKSVSARGGAPTRVI